MNPTVPGASPAAPIMEEQQLPATSCGFFTITVWEGILRHPGLLTTSTNKCSTSCYEHENVLCSTCSDCCWYLPLAPQLKSAINHPPPYQLQSEIATKITEVSRRVSGAHWSPLCLPHYIFNFFCCHNSWKPLASTTSLIYLHHKLTTAKCNLFLRSQHNKLSP